MPKKANSINTGKGYDEMEPDLLLAAEYNDFDEALRAYKHDKTCVNDTTDNGLNALQVSLINFHDEMSLFLVNHMKVSTIAKDYFGKDSLAYSLKYSNPELCGKIYERWLEEKTTNNILPLNPAP